MKKLVLLSVLALCVSPVLADNLFQYSNPFPQTNPERMNNLYEAEQSTIQQEAKQVKKSWFKKGKNLQEQERQEAKQKGINTYPNEGTNDGSFYMFK